MAKAKQVVTIDPSMQFDMHLRFMEKHAAWHVFRRLYWGFFVFIIGILALTSYGLAPGGQINVVPFLAWVLLFFSLFYVMYGIIEYLHLRLIRKYA